MRECDIIARKMIGLPVTTWMGMRARSALQICHSAQMVDPRSMSTAVCSRTYALNNRCLEEGLLEVVIRLLDQTGRVDTSKNSRIAIIYQSRDVQGEGDPYLDCRKIQGSNRNRQWCCPHSEETRCSMRGK